MKVLVVGSAVLDLMASPMPAAPDWKEKQRIGSIRIGLGGDAANQSVRLADLGAEVWLCAGIGADSNGQLIRNMLEQRGVHGEYLAVKTESPDSPGAEVSTGAALVLVQDSGERNVFSVRGAHSMLTAEDLPTVEALKQEGFEAVSLASLFSMPLLEADGLEAWLMQVHASGMRVFADLANDKLGLGLEGIRRFLPSIDYFLPSLYDAVEMTGKQTPEEAAEIYAACGCRNVLIKCGAEGCYLHSVDGARIQVAALPVTPVDTTGAGDCMAALFLERILAGESTQEACVKACRGASVSTLYPGASAEPLSWERMEEIASTYETTQKS